MVENFLAPENIRPYILKLKVSKIAGDWLSKSSNQQILIQELSNIILNIVVKLDDKTVVNFISRKAGEMTAELKANQIIGNGLEYLIDRNEHQKIITNLSSQIKNYILQNQEMIRERVKKESFSLIPKFVDDAIADKITNGLSTYFDEVENDLQNPLRKEISKKLADFSAEIKTSEKLKDDFQEIKNSFFQEEKLQSFSQDIWKTIRKTIEEELSKDDSGIKKYVKKNLDELSFNLQNDEALQYKIDHWVRVTAYKYLLKNTHQFGDLISSTVGNWEGEELSRKLELEVGKDLQFIRINGTLVGGLVGLIIYTIAHFFI